MPDVEPRIPSRISDSCKLRSKLTSRYASKTDRNSSAVLLIVFLSPLSQRVSSTSEMAMEGPVLFQGVAKDSLAFRLMTQMVSIFA